MMMPIAEIKIGQRHRRDLGDIAELAASTAPRTGGKGNGEYRSGRIDEAALRADLVSGENYHAACVRLVGKWALQGLPFLQAQHQLEELFDAVFPPDRDQRWQQRRDDIPRVIRDIYGKEAAKNDARGNASSRLRPPPAETDKPRAAIETQAAAQPGRCELPTAGKGHAGQNDGGQIRPGGEPLPPPPPDEPPPSPELPPDGEPPPRLVEYDDFVPPVEFSENALSYKFSERFAAVLVYVHVWGKWLRWEAGCWREDHAVRVFDEARKICAREGERARATLPAKSAAKVAAIINSAAYVAAMERLARHHEPQVRPPELFNADPMLLNGLRYSAVLRSTIIKRRN
jgi:hypothetical protein